MFLTSLLLATVVSSASAQEYMDRNLKMAEPLTVLMIPSGNFPTDPKTDKATLQVVNFGGDGNTISLSLDIKAVKDADPTVNMEYTWSGKNLHLVKKNEAGGGVSYSVIRGSKTLCGALMKVPKGDGTFAWAAQIMTGEGTQTISDVHVGMNRLAVESKCRELGLSQFKFVRQEGNLKLYQLQWLDMKKKRDWFGTEDYHYEMTNDRPYGSFWFDENDKLVKWLLH